MNLQSYTRNLRLLSAKLHESFRAALPLAVLLFYIYSFNYFGFVAFLELPFATLFLMLSDYSLTFFVLLTAGLGALTICQMAQSSKKEL
ncbi:hypothetical protein [Pseudoalteromonas spongiae]|uniref:DUF485 domain-containing protein n=1 Tax=Pseudoalteromonas spongiae TaxID=298657 RepID=A0ABU8EX49_9GAMM